MLRLERNKTQRIVLTLTEKTTINPVFYFLEFFENQDHDSKILTLGTDLSGNTQRYNEFEITENSTEDLPNGIITLSLGDYDYFVWESTSSDFADKVGIVESGKVKVIGDEISVATYDEKPSEYTYGE